jgi:hypothetical protein
MYFRYELELMKNLELIYNTFLKALHTKEGRGKWIPTENGLPGPECDGRGHVTAVSFLPHDLVMFLSCLFAR